MKLESWKCDSCGAKGGAKDIDEDQDHCPKCGKQHITFSFVNRDIRVDVKI